MSKLQLVGRSSSHFTRLPRIFAEELGVALELVPIYDMTLIDPELYGENPALKLPTLRIDDATLFGALNICRAIAERAGQSAQIVWPEQLVDRVSRNAQELIWHCMAAQVQIVFGTIVAKLPADNVYFTKARCGLEGALMWLDQHFAEASESLPKPHLLSVFEVSLFCLIDHFEFRKTVAVAQYPALSSFAREFATRPSAQRTQYKMDTK